MKKFCANENYLKKNGLVTIPTTIDTKDRVSYISWTYLGVKIIPVVKENADIRKV